MAKVQEKYTKSSETKRFVVYEPTLTGGDFLGKLYIKKERLTIPFPDYIVISIEKYRE